MKKNLIGFLAGIMVTASVILFYAFTPEGEKELILIVSDYSGLTIYSPNKTEEIVLKLKETPQEFYIQLKKYHNLNYTIIHQNTSMLDGRVFHSALLEKK